LVLKAMFVVCAVWNWRRTAVALFIGFYALLGPDELVAVKCAHL
jgi:hypothetical protein